MVRRERSGPTGGGAPSPRHRRFPDGLRRRVGACPGRGRGARRAVKGSSGRLPTCVLLVAAPDDAGLGQAGQGVEHERGTDQRPHPQLAFHGITPFAPGTLLRGARITQRHQPTAAVAVPTAGWIGRWGGREIRVEAWEIRAARGRAEELVVEVSFTQDDPTAAARGRDQLRGLFEAEGWLEPRDVLKTELILERY